VVTIGLVALGAGSSYQLITERRLAPSTTAGVGNPKSSSIGSERFAPAENLERIEIGELRAAAQRLRGSQIPLNIAMYAFTDRVIAQLLVEESDAGTVIRIYRDGEQFEEEERQHYGIGSVTSMFRGHANIHIRVKPASRSDLMHLKCWSDGRVLRDGSANWSPAGLKRQDNEIRYTTDGDEVQEFNQDFEQLWNRPINSRVQ
jgi:phosphatidylserine/phosphatidylglycerophosphate/cardiolipin synthase-like enzyme